MESQEKKHTISMLVENEFGVLSRVAGLFAQKGYNIESLSVSETSDPTLSRITLVTSGSDQVLRQILKQLRKLINVLTAEDLTKERHLTREMVLVKLSKVGEEELKKAAEEVGGRVVVNDGDTVILEVTGEDEAECNRKVSHLKRFKVLETVRTGLVALQRGRQVLVAHEEVK